MMNVKTGLNWVDEFNPLEYCYARKECCIDGSIRYFGRNGEYEVLTLSERQHKMGMTAILISDMLCCGATEVELSNPIRYAKVLLDALKYELDWKQAEIDFGIEKLKEKYQPEGVNQ